MRFIELSLNIGLFMKISIQNETVRRNILALQSAVQPLRFKLDTLGEHIHCEFDAFVHKTNGALLLRAPDRMGKEWKIVVLEMELSPSSVDETFFCLYDDQEDREDFRWDDFKPEAIQAISETFHLLNKTSRELFSFTNDPMLLLDAICSIEITSGLQRLLGKDLVHEAWHQLDRVGAERLLQKEQSGTFIFRKDEYVYILENQLKMRFQIPLSCITITFIDKSQKVNDLTIVVKDNRWMFYDDDPNLEGDSYPDIYALLESAPGCFLVPMLVARFPAPEEAIGQRRRTG